MYELTLKFSDLVAGGHEAEARALVESAPRCPETDGLLGYLYYYGIGGKLKSVKMAYVMFERAIRDGDDSMSLYMLGQMCERVETPDQDTGGPRQKYDAYDAPRLMERCMKAEGIMAMAARLWLGEYYIDTARGGDPELGVGYLEKTAEYGTPEAVTVLARHYREMAEYTGWQDEEVNRTLYKWQKLAWENDPVDEGYEYARLLCGIAGIEEDIELALRLFESDYDYGHPAGARALQSYYDAVAADPAFTAGQRAAAAEAAALWRTRLEALESR